MEQRKLKEKEFHNLIRAKDVLLDKKKFDYFQANNKFHSVQRLHFQHLENWWVKNVEGKVILDYCCGRGLQAVPMAKLGAKSVTGIDLSDVSLDRARELAEANGVADLCEFIEMDAENMSFPDNTFDIVHERGSLHHVKLECAYAEIARVLKPDGIAICTEALVHNPLFHLYRKLTPRLRTKWEVEHILGKKEIELAKNYFGKVEVRGHFHLASLLASPFRKSKSFSKILSFFEKIDKVILKIPGIKWLAWCTIYTMSEPKKSNGAVTQLHITK